MSETKSDVGRINKDEGNPMKTRLLFKSSNSIHMYEQEDGRAIVDL